MEITEYKNCFKIKPVAGESDLQRLGELYGGVLKLDAGLWPNEFWYHTNCERETLEKSILVDLLN
ncbi:hypothetical protein SAMN05421676_102348 [Salinibacillus kushneri]|uniref:Uncharacterized protein n=1 Tax=Salinibacillus kushneri TaxID=237682 RepID=A0A1I0B4A4_9BACI|nr:hypothetical protein [Salinibacillus kushneri]SET01615.1 hypothetical protein SAMN05421676_102348 [Salinibacillus kushneri]